MTTYLLIPGAGGHAWYWHRVVPLLPSAVAVDLPGDDPARGLPEYAELIAEAGRGREVVLVAQSLGAFSALPAAARLDVRALVLVNAMIPVPGETAGEWWETSGWSAQRGDEPIDVERDLLHDVPPEVLATGEVRGEAGIVFGQRCAFERWPGVPTTVLAARDDRLFPFEFQRRLARERLALDVQEVPGGHLTALSQPAALADAITRSG